MARWRDPHGRQRTKSFSKKGDAERFVTRVAAEVLRGDYIDPSAGRMTFREYAEQWLEGRTFDPSTREQVALRLRLHAYPVLGHLRLNAITPSTIRAWLRGLTPPLAPRTAKVVFENVASVFAAAVDDDLVRKNPCRASSVRAPRPDARAIVPWSTETVLMVRAALPEPYRIVATLGAGLGLRQGEVFGLSPDDVDFLRGTVTVRRQVKIVGSRLLFAPPKGRKERSVPLPSTVRDELATHLARHPARLVRLPWGDVLGDPIAVPLIVSSRESKALNRNYFNRAIWRPALARAGVEPKRENGMHALRHYYASVLLDAGETIKALSEYLGHRDPGFTLRTYTHLMPSSQDRTRQAIDAALAPDRGYTPSTQDVETGS